MLKIVKSDWNKQLATAWKSIASIFSWVIKSREGSMCFELHIIGIILIFKSSYLIKSEIYFKLLNYFKIYNL